MTKTRRLVAAAAATILVATCGTVAGVALLSQPADAGDVRQEVRRSYELRFENIDPDRVAEIKAMSDSELEEHVSGLANRYKVGESFNEEDQAIFAYAYDRLAGK